MFNFFNKDSEPDLPKLQKYIDKTTNRMMIWGGVFTTILASSLLSLREPLWDIAVKNPIAITQLKTEQAEMKSNQVESDKKLNSHEDTLKVLDAKMDIVLKQLEELRLRR